MRIRMELGCVSLDNKATPCLVEVTSSGGVSGGGDTAGAAKASPTGVSQSATHYGAVAHEQMV